MKSLSIKGTIKRMLKVFLILLLVLVLFTIGRLLLLRQDVSQFKAYWDKIAAASVAPNAITYVALGDSAAQGIGASKPMKGYVGLVANSLAQETNKPVHTINISVSGAKVQDVTDKQLPKLQSLNLKQEDVITLDIGANNMRGYDEASFAREIDVLFSQLPKRTVVADIPYFGGGRANKYEKNAIDASKVIEAAAKKYGLRVAPLHESTRTGDGWSVYAADFFHPSNKGYQNWYDAFWKVLSQ